MKTKQTTFTKTNLKNDVEITGIYTIHYFKYGKNFKFKHEWHNFYEFVYIDSGNAIILADGERFVLKQGEGFLHKPNAKHTIYTDDEFANSAIISFECKNKALLELCGKIITVSSDEKGLLNKVINEAKLSYSDPLNDLNLTKMNKRPKAPFGGEQIIKNCTQLLFVSMLRRMQIEEKFNTPAVDGIHSPLITQILQILQDKLNASNHVTLEEISFNVRYSKSYVKNKFKQETGKSIVQYFIGMKIEKAKKLLSQGDKTVNEVSDSLGFTSVQYFCRQFKLHTDMTPTTYANSIKTDHLI